METDFQKHLRAALNHLYNPEQLRQSPLIHWFKISDRFDAPSVLQRLLIDEIEAMRPKQGELLHSEKRKIYEVLLYRYVQQFKQNEVAHQLGISDRQFRRVQDVALDLFALSIWKKFAPANETSSPAWSDSTPPSGIPDARTYPQPLPEGRGAVALVREEWDWLKNAHSESITNLRSVVQKILDLMQAVVKQYNAVLIFVPGPELPDLAVHLVAFRQILLNLLQVAIHQAVDGKVILELSAHLPFDEFLIRSAPAKAQALNPHQSQDASLIEIAAHLANLCGGHLEILDQAHGFACQLSLPAVEGLRILVIDDNPEIIDLLQRYTNGTRYTVIGSSDPEQAVELAGSSGARIIVLDVIMPKIDGWDLLSRLRAHPQTAGIPLIVLSILAQEDLAYSLGAQKLIQKPVIQEVFLAALDEIWAREAHFVQEDPRSRPR